MSSRFLLLFLFATSPLAATELKTAPAGIEINAGSLGQFTLTYPEFDPPLPQIEAKADGTSATIRYEGGTEAKVSVSNQEITVTFSGSPESAKAWKMTALIDIAFAKGGTWTIDEQQGGFPIEKSTPPQFASRHGKRFALKNAQGQSLAITPPENSFQQLTDNREWNWAIYHWQFFTPALPDKTTATIRVESDLGAVKALIDPFGQPIEDTFPGKLEKESDLQADTEKERSYFEKLTVPVLDRFGGLPGSGERFGLTATGFFHIEEKEGKTWLVDPDGNAFFHLGVCGFAPNDDYTFVKGREGIYEWLPTAEGEFASAFRPGNGDENFSFYLANTIRKYGQPYDYETHAARMMERLRKWGFNSIGAFSPTPAKAHIDANFPYVAHLPTNEWEGVPRIPGAHEVWDPYDAATARKIEENLARELPGRAADPLLIGWFIVNEPRYDELPRVIPSLDATHACKRRFGAFLEEKYGDIAKFNAAWKASDASFDEVVAKAQAVSTEAAKSDVKAFVGEFLETYFAQIEDVVRKHDPNHLLLGSRLQPITIEDETLCRIMGEHLDVISYNYYTYGVDAAALRRYHEWCGGKPMMLSEFFWSSPSDSGLVGGRSVSSQQERGLAYRNYVEQSAALGFVVGIEWFTLVDQAATGRWFSKYNGESYNTGLISVADRPWYPMLDEMMKTNHGIYDLLLGRKEPFAWGDPRFAVKP